MALSVTTASPGQISGVTTASPGSISGVTTASGGSISGVVSSPYQSTYNPQTTSNPIKTVNPQTTTNPQTGAVAPQQTFKLGDGSVYNSNGALVSGPTTPTGVSSGTQYTGNATMGSPATSFTSPTPAVSQQSTSLTNDTSYSDIQKLLTNSLANMDKLFSNMSAYSTVSPEEKAQQQKVAQEGAQVLGLQDQAAGFSQNAGSTTYLTPFSTGQGRSMLMSAQMQQQLDQSILNYMQGNRQFAFNSASQIYDASRQNLETALDVYSKTAPQNIGTNYNPTSGQLTAIMRNPLTGATYTGDLGNIGAQHQFTSTNITTDPMTGALTFVGTTSDGRVVQQPIGGGSSFSSGSLSSPLSGNYTQTTNPQFSNVGSLISNWTSGGTTMPGNGYQNAVYSTFQQLTGTPINAGTPTSTLISNIPALSQSIAKAEGYGKGAVGDRINNPGNILWANQPNATPYTSSNGLTYAKFNTQQDGWNAMNDLLAKKLGASPQTPAASSDLSSVISKLPPALQQPGAIHYLPDGTPYFNASTLTSAQIPMAQSYAKITGISYIDSTSANKLDDISVVKQSLSELSNFVDKNFNDGLVGKIWNPISFNVGSMLGGNAKTNLERYRTTAMNTIQSLAGGTGSGFKLTQSEINTAIDSLPKDSDIVIYIPRHKRDSWVSFRAPLFPRTASRRNRRRSRTPPSP